jgi:hypothetical protein
MIDQFTDLKEWTMVFTGVSKDALHVHMSLLLVCAAARLTRRPLGSLLPWSMVLALALLNELLDYLSDPYAADWQEAALHDVANTMLWPTVLIIAARRFRQRSAAGA